MAKKIGKKQEKQSTKESKEKSPEPQSSEKLRPSAISWIVFFFTISVVILSLIPVVFPSAIVANFTQVNDLEQLGISGLEMEIGRASCRERV